MALDVRNVGSVKREMRHNQPIQECKASEFQDRFISALRGHAEEPYVHCIYLQLSGLRFSDIDCKNSVDVVYAAKNSKVVDVWSTHYPGKVHNNWTMTPQRINLRIGLMTGIIYNSDFLRIKQLLHPSIVTTISYMAQHLIFTGCKDGSVRMFDSFYELVDTWTENMTNVSDIHYNTWILDQFAATSHNSIRGPKNYHTYGATLFSFYRKKPVGFFFSHYEPTERVRFSKDGRLLATVDRQGELHLWDRQAPVKPIRTFYSGNPLENKKVEFSPDDKFIATKNRGAVDIYDVGTGKKYIQLPVSISAAQNFDFTYGAYGRTIAMGGADGILKIWDIPTALSSPRAFQEFPIGAPICRIQCSLGSIYNCVC